MIRRLVDLLKTYDNPRFWAKNISWRLPSTISDIDVIFVVGSPRSGTTLLQRILSIHSQLFSIEGETGLFSYQNIFDPRRKHFGLSDGHLRWLYKESIDIVDFFEKGVQILSDENGGRFVEKTPQHVLYLPFILKHFPNAQIIHIVRDGRDCYCSSKSHQHIPQNKSIVSFAKYWKKCVNVPRMFKQDSRILEMKYEYLVEEPRVYLPKIMTFLGLSIEEIQFDSSQISNDKRAKLKEFSHLKDPINSSSVERWKTELTDFELKKFNTVAGRELELYGYSLTNKD